MCVHVCICYLCLYEFMYIYTSRNCMQTPIGLPNNIRIFLTGIAISALFIASSRINNKQINTKVELNELCTPIYQNQWATRIVCEYTQTNIHTRMHARTLAYLQRRVTATRAISCNNSSVARAAFPLGF